MRLVIAIIRPLKLHAVREALEKIGVERMTVCDAQGYGRQRGQTAIYRGNEYKTNLLRKIALEIVVNEDFLDRALKNDAITSEAFEINLDSLTLHLTDQDTVLDNFEHI